MWMEVKTNNICIEKVYLTKLYFQSRFNKCREIFVKIHNIN